jgi:hypothetical protein
MQRHHYSLDPMFGLRSAAASERRSGRLRRDEVSIM